MTKGYYKPIDIRTDGLLKLKKLKERDAIANPRQRCVQQISRANAITRTWYMAYCGRLAVKGGCLCWQHGGKTTESKGGQS